MFENFLLYSKSRKNRLAVSPLKRWHIAPCVIDDIYDVSSVAIIGKNSHRQPKWPVWFTKVLPSRYFLSKCFSSRLPHAWFQVNIKSTLRWQVWCYISGFLSDPFLFCVDVRKAIVTVYKLLRAAQFCKVGCAYTGCKHFGGGDRAQVGPNSCNSSKCLLVCRLPSAVCVAYKCQVRCVAYTRRYVGFPLKFSRCYSLKEKSI